jgi:hypothetical protein
MRMTAEVIGVLAALAFALVPCWIAYEAWLYSRREKK